MIYQVLSAWMVLAVISSSFGSPFPESRNSNSKDISKIPLNDDETDVLNANSEMDSRGFHGDTFDEGFKRFSPYKRSNSASRIKRDTLDPGYMSYMSSIGYNPSMAFGKKKRNDYFQSVGYDPSLWSNRNDFGNYYYPQHFMGSAYKRGDSTFNDVFVPYQQFHTFKRSPDFSDYYTNQGIYKRSVENDDYNESINVRNKREIDDSKDEKQKRRPEMDQSRFHGDMLSNGFGDLYTLKKRMGARGFHGDTFNQGFGDFSTMRKRRPEMDSSGFYGDTFSGGFGDFYTMKRNNEKRRPEMDSSGFYGDTFSGGFGEFNTMKRNPIKRRPEMDSSGFYGDTFSGGFGDFYTMKKRPTTEKQQENSQSIKEETSNRKKREVDYPFREMKRRPEMTSSGFYGDTFSNGFGDFYTMKKSQKRRPEMDSSGFYGDTFSGGFGDFYTMKKSTEETQNPELLKFKLLKLMNQRSKRDISGIEIPDHSEDNAFEQTDDDLRVRRNVETLNFLQNESPINYPVDENYKETPQKRHVGIDSRGFQGDTFSDGFGDFTTMKKR